MSLTQSQQMPRGECDCVLDDRIHQMCLRSDLPVGVSKVVRLHCMHDQSVTLSHTFSLEASREEALSRRRTILCQNELRIFARYVDGHLSDQISISMRVTFPQGLGLERLWGVDISPGGRANLGFVYHRIEGSLDFECVRIEWGHHRWDPRQQEEALIAPRFGFPFPAMRRLETIYGTHGGYRIPFLTGWEPEVIEHAELPSSLRERG